MKQHNNKNILNSKYVQYKFVRNIATELLGWGGVGVEWRKEASKHEILKVFRELCDDNSSAFYVRAFFYCFCCCYFCHFFCRVTNICCFFKRKSWFLGSSALVSG